MLRTSIESAFGATSWQIRACRADANNIISRVNVHGVRQRRLFRSEHLMITDSNANRYVMRRLVTYFPTIVEPKRANVLYSPQTQTDHTAVDVIDGAFDAPRCLPPTQGNNILHRIPPSGSSAKIRPSYSHPGSVLHLLRFNDKCATSDSNRQSPCRI